MGVIILDNATGISAQVSPDFQLRVRSENRALQHNISFRKENTYQVQDTTTPANGTKTLLHIKNTDTNLFLCISYIRLQFVVGAGTAPPNTGTYFDLLVDDTVASGGDTLTPTNMNRRSGKAASVTATGNGPTMDGVGTQIDQYVVESDGKMQTYNKEGSIILGLNNTFSIRVVHDNASGYAYGRITFMMIEPK